MMDKTIFNLAKVSTVPCTRKGGGAGGRWGSEPLPQLLMIKSHRHCLSYMRTLIAKKILVMTFEHRRRVNSAMPANTAMLANTTTDQL